jgi:two-component sensor histidine kinase
MKSLQHYLNYPFFVSTVKGFFKINDDSLIVANRNSLLLFNPTTFKITDTLWRERTTTAFYYNDTIYSATLDGLLVLDKKKHAFFPGNTEPLLRNKITSITNINDIIWIATYGVGVLGYYHGKVIMNITEKDGLTSNICRCINAAGNILWVGTDKGLNRIDLSRKPYHITKITSADALVSDIINTIYVDNGIVYVGTPEGITYFNGKKIVSYSRCDLRITQVIIGQDTLKSDANNFTLTHKNNDISFGFSGISFKSAGEITYHYRLKGLDTSWQTTTQNFINYTTLPSGKYSFQLKAVNKFGVESNAVNIRFEVAQRLWEKGWFKLLIAACIILLIWFIVRARIRYINKRNEEKMATMQRITELEQMALKSQMNPHFIFNSLNSIQQYVMDKDVEGANKFITAFSKLIRKTLEFSNKKRISVAEEMEYLSTYLALERERLSNKFIYNIRFKDQLNYNEVFIPPMILQPYVENSVRHGIRYRNDDNGVVDISVKQKNGSLFVIVEDNGIGRKEASKYKSKNIIHYQSKGMSLTASRIEMMNEKSEAKMKVLIEDLEENNVAKGTRVTIIFPVDEGNYEH